MHQAEAFGQPLEPEPGFVPRPSDAAEIARRDTEYLGLEEPADADDIFGTVPPEHSWPGTALVLTLYAVGLFAVARVLFLLRDTEGMTLSQVLATLPMMLFPGLLLLWTARKVQTFRLVGLGVAIFLLLGSLVAGVTGLPDAEGPAGAGFALLGVALSILWIGYLWTHRSDFS